MRLILIAHGLIHRSGHHYMEARALKEEGARIGLECTILAHRDISPPIREELQVLPLFEYDPYKKLRKKGYFASLKDFLFFSRSMAQRLMSLPPGLASATDILISPLTTAHEMLGLALWLSSTPRKQHPFVVINFMIDNISRPAKENNSWKINAKEALFYKIAFYRLKKAISLHRFLLVSGGDAFSQAMGKIVKHHVQTFPLPVQHEIPFAQPEDINDRPPLIAFLGYAKRQKGTSLVGAIVRRVLKKHPNCRFVLQANPVKWEKRWADEIGQVGMERVHIHKGEMTQDEYQVTMQNCHIVLLPYPPTEYTLQTSGVFSEAVAMGKVSVVPHNTWLGDMASRNGGGTITFQGHSVESIAEATLKALDRLSELTKEMQNISVKWRENMGMRAFLQKILAAAKE